jgi:hypothetical protein
MVNEYGKPLRRPRPHLRLRSRWQHRRHPVGKCGSNSLRRTAGG